MNERRSGTAMRCLAWIALGVGLAGCGGDAPTADTSDGAVDAVDMVPDGVVRDRRPGERRPLTADCDPTDATRCLLPWPSSAFTVADASTRTGLRLHVAATSLWPDDDASLIVADGFSRLGPIMTALAGALPTLPEVSPDGPLVLLVAEGDAVGARVPLRLETIAASVSTLLVGWPLRPLAGATEHAAIVLGPLSDAAGVALIADRRAQLALGLVPPADASEAALLHDLAPGRAAIAAAGIDPARVLRIWGFVTRSLADAVEVPIAMAATARTAVAEGDVDVVIDSVTPVAGLAGALDVRGRMLDVPLFLDADGLIAREAAGAPRVVGTTEAPFRALLPPGVGDYPAVLFGHGSGAPLGDPLFDEVASELGAAKVTLAWRGWDEAGIVSTFDGFRQPVRGVARASAGLMQSLADGAALVALLRGRLGEVLAAPMLGGQSNAFVGRRPDASSPVWAANSLGGVMGMVFAQLEPSIPGGALNVPGAVWSQWLPGAQLWPLLRVLVAAAADSPDGDEELDGRLALALGQSLFDPVDGAAWVDVTTPVRTFLVQASLGDPVLPPRGVYAVARALGARRVGAELEPMPGIDAARLDAEPGAQGNVITQYRVSATAPYDIHDFAGRDTPAGAAARAQVVAFLRSLRAGAALATVPAGCAEPPPLDACDFP